MGSVPWSGRRTLSCNFVSCLYRLRALNKVGAISIVRHRVSTHLYVVVKVGYGCDCHHSAGSFGMESECYVRYYSL